MLSPPWMPGLAFPLHVLLHKLSVWDGFLFEFMCLKFCKTLCWKLINLSAQIGAWWVHAVVYECISYLKNINFVKPSFNFPVWQFLFTYASSQVISMLRFLGWVHVIHILQKAYVKVNQYICRNRCRMHGCIMLLMH